MTNKAFSNSTKYNVLIYIILIRKVHKTPALKRHYVNFDFFFPLLFPLFVNRCLITSLIVCVESGSEYSRGGKKTMSNSPLIEEDPTGVFVCLFTLQTLKYGA